MNVNIYELLREKFSGAASRGLSEILGRSSSEVGPITDKSIETVLDSFSSLSNDASARERLFEAVTQSDERAMEDPGVILRGRDRQSVLVDGNNKLANIVGIANKNRMTEKLRLAAGLSSTEAEDVLGYIAPGVLGGMKKQISAGVVANSSVGLTQLLGKSNTGAAVVTANADTVKGGQVPANSAAYANTSHAHPTAQTAGNATTAASGDVSWIRRFALPFLLLGALLLGTMKYCSNVEHTRVVAKDRDDLQSELVGVREQAESSTAKVASLSTELEGANANVVRLQGEVDTVTAELEEVKAIPTDTAELQGLLASATAERDAFVASKNELQTEFDKVLVERDAALNEVTGLQEANAKAREEAAALEQQIQSLNGELETTQAKVTETESTLAQREESLTSINTDLETARTEMSELTSERDELLNKRDALAARVSELLAEKDTVVAETDDLKAQIETLNGNLESARTSDADSRNKLGLLNSSFSGLQDKLSLVTGARDEASNQAKGLRIEVADLKKTTVELQSGLQRAQEEHDAALAAMQTERDSAQTELDGVKTELGAEIDTLTTQRDEALAQVTEANAELDALNVQKAEAQARIDELQGQTGQLEASLQEEVASVSELQSKVAALDETRASLTGERDEALSEVTSLTARIDATNDALTSEQATVAELNTRVATLEEQNAALTADRDSAKSSLSGLTEEMQVVQSAMQVEQANVSELSASVASLRESNAALTGELEAATAQGAELREQLDSLQATLQQEQSTVSELQASLASLDELKTSIAGDRDGAKQIVANLTGQLQTLKGALKYEQKTVGQLNGSVADLDGANATLTGERDAALGDIAMLQQKLDSAGGQIESLSVERDDLQQQISDAAAREQSTRDATLAVRAEIEQKLLAAGVTAASVSAIDDDRAVAITLGSGDLYQVGSASLSPQGNAVLSNVGSVVTGYSDWNVDVVGHTDSQGIGAELRKRYPTNWELSTARASAAVRYLASKSGVDADKLSARGLGDTRPLATNETAQGREQNRRVDFILRR